MESPINQVTKHAEFPQTQIIDKVVVDTPVVMQRQVPQIQSVSKTVEMPINQVTKHAEFPQTQYIDKVVVDLPVVMQRQVPRIRTVLKTVEDPPTQFVGRVMEALMACVRWHPQNAAASPRASRTTHAMNVASETVPHASGMRAQDARRLHRRPSFHAKLDVDVGEVATGGDFILMTSLF